MSREPFLSAWVYLAGIVMVLVCTAAETAQGAFR
jgi:hypothetical protein